MRVAKCENAKKIDFQGLNDKIKLDIRVQLGSALKQHSAYINDTIQFQFKFNSKSFISETFYLQ